MTDCETHPSTPEGKESLGLRANTTKSKFIKFDKPAFFMLILSRKPEQSIIINSNIVVTVLSVDRDVVKLGIDAPEEVPVNREEVELAIQGAKLHLSDVAMRSPRG